MAEFQGLRDTPKRIIADIQALEDRAHKLGMTITAQTLNRAGNVAGWWLSGNQDMEIKAQSGER